MKHTKHLVFIFIFSFWGLTLAQNKLIFVNTSARFGNSFLQLADSCYKTNDTNNLQIEVLRFYISNIQFLNNGKLVLAEKNSVHLIDAAAKKPMQFTVENNAGVEYDELKFNVGIDSTTNVAGALGGELDPTNGMYWTWQNGYINFKLEGKSKLCKTRNNEFQFHLGGYLQPNNCLQTVSLKMIHPTEVNIRFDVQDVLKKIDLTKQNHIMSPSSDAVLISKIVAESFYLFYY